MGYTERGRTELKISELISILSTIVGHPIAHFGIAYVTPDGKGGHVSSFAHRSPEIAMYANIIEDLAEDIHDYGDEHGN